MKKPMKPKSEFLVLCQGSVLAVAGLVATAARAQTFGCDPAMANPIVCENSKPGNPSSQWDINGSGDPSIQGFATDISVNQGETVHLKIDTDASAYRIDIYRLGYYAGLGARKVASILPSATLPQNQPSCLSDTGTGLIDCGNWGVCLLVCPAERHLRNLFCSACAAGHRWGKSHLLCGPGRCRGLGIAFQN